MIEVVAFLLLLISCALFPAIRIIIFAVVILVAISVSVPDSLINFLADNVVFMPAVIAARHGCWG